MAALELKNLVHTDVAVLRDARVVALRPGTSATGWRTTEMSPSMDAPLAGYPRPAESEVNPGEDTSSSGETPGAGRSRCWSGSAVGGARFPHQRIRATVRRTYPATRTPPTTTRGQA